MARKGVFGVPGDNRADRLSRMAVYQREERRAQDTKTVNASPMIRLALAAVGGIFLLMSGTGAIWAWLGAVAWMLAVLGASPPIGAAAGAVAAFIAYFRLTGDMSTTGAFWLVLILYTGGGALAGVLASIISRRLPPQAFAFLAALLPAGLEQAGSFGLTAELYSTALTQYSHPFIVDMARLGGLAGVTYVIFVFGAAIAVAVRYAMQPGVIASSAGPALGFVVLGLVYGAISGASTDRRVNVVAFNLNDLRTQREALMAETGYDADKWTAYMQAAVEQGRNYSTRPTGLSAMGRDVDAKGFDMAVWPEAAVALNAATREKFLSQLEAVAKISNCAQVASFYDADAAESRTVVTGPDFKPVVGYARISYKRQADNVILGDQLLNPGAERPKAFVTAAGRVGVLLSLDANRFDNFASIAADGGQMVAVVGLEDEKTPEASLKLLAFNAARAGLPVVRVVHDGRLAVIDADGEIVDEQQTSESMATVVNTSLALGSGSTAYLKVGAAFGWLALVVGLVAGLYASSLRDPFAEQKDRKRRGGAGNMTFRTKGGEEEV